MRAFVVSQYKGPLQQADVPEPVVGEHDVLVQVRAARPNALDEKIRPRARRESAAPAGDDPLSSRISLHAGGSA